MNVWRLLGLTGASHTSDFGRKAADLVDRIWHSEANDLSLSGGFPSKREDSIVRFSPLGTFDEGRLLQTLVSEAVVL